MKKDREMGCLAWMGYLVIWALGIFALLALALGPRLSP